MGESDEPAGGEDRIGSSTPYDKRRAEWSDRAHRAAQELIYPEVFGVPKERLQFESTLLADSPRGEVLDGELGVDRIVHVSVGGLMKPIQFTVQERFRSPAYAKYQDLTVTEWNHASGLPSELYKITAELFLYGYYDDQARRFTDALLVNVADLKFGITRGTLRYERVFYEAKQQSFLTFKFSGLEQAGAVVYRKSRYALPVQPAMRMYDGVPVDGTRQVLL